MENKTKLKKSQKKYSEEYVLNSKISMPKLNLNISSSEENDIKQDSNGCDRKCLNSKSNNLLGVCLDRLNMDLYCTQVRHIAYDLLEILVL